MQCSADAFEIAFQRVHLDMVHVARLDDAYPLLADPQGLRQSLLGDVFGLAGLLELVEPDLLQHAPFLGLDLVAGDAAVGHEPLRCVAHRSVSFPYRSSSHTR